MHPNAPNSGLRLLRRNLYLARRVHNKLKTKLMTGWPISCGSFVRWEGDAAATAILSRTVLSDASDATRHMQHRVHLQSTSTPPFAAVKRIQKQWISCDFLEKAHRCSIRRYVFQKRLSCEAPGSRPVTQISIDKNRSV